MPIANRLTSRLTPCALLWLVAIATASGCAAPTRATRDFSDPAHRGTAFSNVLVIAQAESLNSRAQFERAVVKGLNQSGAAASPYFKRVDHKAPINRATVREALKGNSFDAVLITRVLDGESALDVGKDVAGARATRRDGRALDFFRYDYKETPVSGAVSLHAAATLQTDLYRVADEVRIWTATYSNANSDSAEGLIDDAAAAIVTLLKRDRLIK